MHTTIGVSVRTTPNSMQGLFNVSSIQIPMTSIISFLSNSEHKKTKCKPINHESRPLICWFNKGCVLKRISMYISWLEIGGGVVVVVMVTCRQGLGQVKGQDTSIWSPLIECLH